MRAAKSNPSLRPQDRGHAYPANLRKARDQFEGHFLKIALELNHGNVSQTSKMIGISRRNLQLKIRKHEIDLTGIRHEYEREEIMMI
ncbi:MAG: helix-turn-helix domain-containing protein [Calditrichota bacterium]